MSEVETVEQFLARGGQVEVLPRGAMAEAGWTPAQLIRVAATGNTGQGAVQAPTPPDSVPVTGVHRQPRKPSNVAPEPRSPSAVTAARATKPTRSPMPPRSQPVIRANGRYDGSKTVAVLDALATGWQHVSQLAKATGQNQNHLSAMLTQLRHRGLVISAGQRPRMLWALPTATSPSAAVLPPREFEGLTNVQLLNAANDAREQVRECQRRIVRLEREIKLRSRAARTGA